MGSGPSQPRFHRRYFINGQAGSRKMDGSGNRTGYNGVKNKHAYGYLTGAQGPYQQNTTSNASNCMSAPSTDQRSMVGFALGVGHGGTGGGPAEQGSGVYTVDSNGGGGVGGSYSQPGPNNGYHAAHTSTALNTYRVHYYVSGTNAGGIHNQVQSSGGGGWGASGGIHSFWDFVNTTRRTAYGGSGGNAIKTNGYSCTISSGSNRIYGSIVS